MNTRLILAFAVAASSGCSGEECSECNPPTCGDSAPAGDPTPGDVSAGDGDLVFGLRRVFPSDESGNIPPGTPVTLEFTHPVNAATVTVQADTGPCQASSSVQISHDGFTTCFGGTLDFTANPVVTFTPKHGLFVVNQTYRIKVTTAVEAADGAVLTQELDQATGFRTTRPACTAARGFVAESTTGASCRDPDFVDNGDGTVTDRANGLLWLQCTLEVNGAPIEAADCAYNPAFALNTFTVSGALLACEELVFAGRDDWVLADIARLETIVDSDASSAPYIDETYFPNPRTDPPLASYHSSSSFDTDTSWEANFSSGTLATNDSKQHAAWVRCVADNPEPVAPELSPLRLFSVTTNRIILRAPLFDVIPTPFPTVEAFIGIDGTISVDGTTVTNYVESQSLDLHGKEWQFPFASLTADTSYRIVVVAENAAGSSVSEVVARTGQIGPRLAPLKIARYDDTSITLAQPAFTTRGYPAPTVNAYLGLDGVITVAGTTVSNYIDIPVDVSSGGHTFTSLSDVNVYRIIVVAENTVSHSVEQVSQQLGRFIDLGLEWGRVLDTHTGLIWERCAHGQTWVESESTCYGTAVPVTYCTEDSNFCNGGANNGLLGPYRSVDPDIWSGAYDLCPGYPTWTQNNWRVPTVEELSTLVDDYAGGETHIDHTAFPNSPPDGQFVSSTSASEFYFCAIWFSTGEINCLQTKSSTYNLRCVTNDP